MQSYHTWAHEQSIKGYDMTTLENSPRFPINMFKKVMEPRHRVVSISFGPELLGFPTVRKRSFTTALNLETMIWVGPEKDEDISKDFISHFCAQTLMDGGDFAGIDSDESHHKLERYLCEVRGRWPGKGKEFDLREALPPYARLFYDEYMKMIVENDRDKNIASGRNEGGRVVDLSQRPSRGRCGPWIPTLLRNTRLVYMSKDGGKMYTSDELDYSQGWPTIRFTNNLKYTKALSYDFTRLSLSQRESIAGNGIHLASFMAWILYVSSNIVRRNYFSATASVGALTYQKQLLALVDNNADTDVEEEAIQIISDTSDGVISISDLEDASGGSVSEMSADSNGSTFVFDI
jgi:hypothetical protein